MAVINTDRKIGIYAQSNYGKTWLATEIIKYICAKGDKVVVYDTDYNDSRYKWSEIKNCYVFPPDKVLGENPAYLNRFILEMRGAYSNFWFFIDDLEVFFESTTSLSLDFGELKNTVNKGRHQNIGLIYTSKIGTHIPSQVLLNTNLFYIGAFPTDKSIKNLSEIVSMKEIMKLDYSKHEFIEVDVNNNYKKRLIK